MQWRGGAPECLPCTFCRITVSVFHCFFQDGQCFYVLGMLGARHCAYARDRGGLAACRDFLRQHRGCFSAVIACDARDTLFQANVFTLPIVEGTQHLPVVLVGTEDPPRGAGFKDTTVSLAEQEHNQHWLDTCFGASSYNHSERRSIVCSGFLAGNAAGMEALSSTIIDVFKDRCCTAGHVTGLIRGLSTGSCTGLQLCRDSALRWCRMVMLYSTWASLLIRSGMQ